MHNLRFQLPHFCFAATHKTIFLQSLFSRSLSFHLRGRRGGNSALLLINLALVDHTATVAGAEVAETLESMLEANKNKVAQKKTQGE